MKHVAQEAYLALAAPLGGLWARVPKLWQAVLVVIGILGVGITVGAAGVNQFNLPARVTSNEATIANVVAQQQLDRANAEEQECLLRRMICRQDGGTGHRCDLRWGVVDGRCTATAAGG